MRKFSLSPALFLILEFFILLPSLLFSMGFILWVVCKYSTLFTFVISGSFVIQNIGVMIISPLAGGFLSYQYLERYKPTGFIKLIAKGILAYSIIEIGLVLIYFLINFVSR